MDEARLAAIQARAEKDADRISAAVNELGHAPRKNPFAWANEDRLALLAHVGVLRADNQRLRDGGGGLIAAERQRQIEAEGWTPEHDAEHINGELADAAAIYLAHVQYGQHGDHLYGWRTPAHNWVKDGPDRMRMLVKAGALIAAEIDRLLAVFDG